MESKTEMTLDDSAIQFAAGTKQEDDQNVVKEALPLANIDQCTIEEKQLETVKEKDFGTDTGKSCFDSKNLGDDKIDATSMTGCTEASGEAPGTCSDSNSENQYSRITANIEGSQALTPKTESSVEERRDISTSKDELHDSTVTPSDEVKDSIVTHKKQVEPFVKTEAKIKEAAEQTE